MTEVKKRQLNNELENKVMPSKTEMLSKVPEVTIFFWIIKVLCTTVGETASDFLNVNLGFGLTGTSIAMGILLGVAFFFQFRAKKYVATTYWLTVVLISIFGTLITDNMTDQMGIPLEVSTIIFSIALIVTFAIWYINEKTLSIHSIFTKKREVFYWLTILFTFALGTASGDLMAESLGFGYLITGAIVCVIIAVVTVAWKLKLDAVLAFWIVYIMTRPLGASLGDFLTQPPKYGGLGLGATLTTVIFIGAILLTVVYLAITKKDLVPAKPSAQTQTTGKRFSVFTQVIVVACVFAFAGGVGYSWQHSKILNESQISLTQASEENATQIETSGSVSQAEAPTPQDSQKAATTSSGPQMTTLGDLSSFITIEQDTLNDVNTGDMSAAKSRVDDLEYTWDNAAATLKPKDAAKWTRIDTTIDNVLRQVRAANPNAASCKSALETSLAALYEGI